MSEESNEEKNDELGPLGVDGVTLLYVLGGIPAIVAFVVILFVLTGLFPDSVPA